MGDIYKVLGVIQHNVKKIRDFSSGSYRMLARQILVDIDKLIELLEKKEGE